MNKYYLIVLMTGLLGKCLLGNNLPLEVPEGSIMPEIHQCELPEIVRDPFGPENLENKNEIEIVSAEQLSDYLRAKVNGYLESNEPTKSYCLWEGSKVVTVGDVLSLKGVPGVEKGIIDLKLISIRSPFLVFKYGDKDFNLNMDRRLWGATKGDKPTYVVDKVVAKGAIVHPNGWIVATNAMLEDKNNLWVYIQDVPYPVKLITVSKAHNLSLLKMFNVHNEIKLPYIPLETSYLEAGDTILVQEFFGQEAPYKKQVFLKNEGEEEMYEPLIKQHAGAISLNEGFKLVGFYSERYVTQRELQVFLGPLANIQGEAACAYPLKATVNIIQE